ncbi:hypothetical protein RUND412_006796 [Rhizina undulata]
MPSPAPSSFPQILSDAIESIGSGQRPNVSTFHFFDNAPNPILVFEDMVIGLPLFSTVAEAITKVAPQHWYPWISTEVLPLVLKGVSVDQSMPVGFELTKMSLYKEGTHSPHLQDFADSIPSDLSEPDLIARMEMVLPSKFTGGSISHSNEGSERSFDLGGPQSLLRTSCIAWYPGVQRFVAPINNGYILILEYKITLKDATYEKHSYATADQKFEDLAHVLRFWDNGHIVKALIKSVEMFEGIDITKFMSLLDSAQDIGFEIYLARTKRHITTKKKPARANTISDSGNDSTGDIKIEKAEKNRNNTRENASFLQDAFWSPVDIAQGRWIKFGDNLVTLLEQEFVKNAIKYNGDYGPYIALLIFYATEERRLDLLRKLIKIVLGLDENTEGLDNRVKLLLSLCKARESGQLLDVLTAETEIAVLLSMDMISNLSIRLGEGRFAESEKILRAHEILFKILGNFSGQFLRYHIKGSKPPSTPCLNFKNALYCIGFSSPSPRLFGKCMEKSLIDLAAWVMVVKFLSKALRSANVSPITRRFPLIFKKIVLSHILSGSGPKLAQNEKIDYRLPPVRAPGAKACCSNCQELDDFCKILYHWNWNYSWG